jgi:hypothetical protein
MQLSAPVWISREILSFAPEVIWELIFVQCDFEVASHCMGLVFGGGDFINSMMLF